MTTLSASRAGGAGLSGRRRECDLLDGVIDAVRAGESRALVLRGQPGIGKTALLEYLADRASGCRVARVVGVQSEMELAFAGLHQLLASMLDRMEHLPGPQRDALRTGFGLSPGSVPDRFLVGLAVLGLLSEVAADRPLICVVDDEQWLDRASSQALAFVARRLGAEAVGLVLAARTPSDHLAGLPELVIENLSQDDARVLLDSVLQWPMDASVRDQIVTETGGNPLALLELAHELTPAEFAGGFGLPGAQRPSSSIEQSFRRRIQALPPDTQRLMLVAAADPVGEPLLVWRAAGLLGIRPSAATPAAQAGLLEIGVRVRFRHPLVRSAAYRSASVEERRAVHGALAEATDPDTDPDRHAWHRAMSASGPDEDVAAELEDCAGRAQARGGLAAAAAFLEHAAALTVDPARLTERALAAAQAKLHAGASDAAVGLLGLAEAGELDELQRARVDLLRAQLAFVSSRGSDAPPLLLSAAKRFERLDVGLARETYLDTMSAAIFAGRQASPGGGVLEVSRAARAAPPAPDPSRASDLLLDGLAVRFCEGYAAGLPILRRAVSAFASGVPAEEGLRWLWSACIAALYLWDDESWELLSSRHVGFAREAGALSELPLALSSRVYVHLFAGELTTAESVNEQVRAAMEATGSSLASYGALGLAAFQGREAEAVALTEASRTELAVRGEGIGLTVAEWANAVLYNGLARYREAFTAAQRACEYPRDLLSATWGLVELIEASVRGGSWETAADAHRRFREMAHASGTDWALGVEARSHALVTKGQGAESHYRESIERLGRTRMRMDLARAHLLYGEWLHGEKRRADAREQLRRAREMFGAMGAEAFGERTRLKLLAVGETVRKPAIQTPGELTTQEAHIARLARDGLSNPEIGARLFISPRTVQYHLRKVFTKLEISSRTELDRVLADAPKGAPP